MEQVYLRLVVNCVKLLPEKKLLLNICIVIYESWSFIMVIVVSVISISIVIYLLSVLCVLFN